jgi:fermentation-respiration switch protein FrsA (DUF1100 family)
MSNRFDSLAKIGKCTRPVFAVHGTADELVPFKQGETLFEAANEPKQFLRLPGLDHNSPLPDEFFEKLDAFLTSHGQK